MLQDKEELVKNFISKLISYATGHAPGFAEKHEIDRLYKLSRKYNYGARSIVQLITLSPLFRRK